MTSPCVLAAALALLQAGPDTWSDPSGPPDRFTLNRSIVSPQDDRVYACLGAGRLFHGIPSTGEWTEKPNYFDVTVWGNQGENCAQYLSKGRPVAIDGRLEWREWEAQDGTKRQAVEVIADTVQFLGGRDAGEAGGNQFVPAGAGASTADADFGGGSDDDIPF